MTLAVLAGALLFSQALPAAALDVTRTAEGRVLGELRSERLTVRLRDGSVARGNLLRFPETARDLSLRPRLANGTVTGLQTMSPMARNEFAKGGIAGTNGGYWIDRPSGNPNGLHVQDGRMVGSNASADGGGLRSRSALGIDQTGVLALDRIAVEQILTLPGGRVPITFMNRAWALGNDVILYTNLYGRSFPVPAGSTLVITEELRPASSGRSANTVRRVVRPAADTTAAVEAGTSAILVNRSALPAGSPDAAALAALSAGDRVGVETSVLPVGTDPSRWTALSGALPAGGTLLRNGSIPGTTEWYGEAFRSGHFSSRHPRTAIGRTPAGEALLLTFDGRQAGWSVGLTGTELAQVFQQLGATEAVNLDGGGSTTMTIGGEIRNRPSQVGRSVASGLFVYAPLPPQPRTQQRFACPEQMPLAGFRDIAGNTHERAIHCLAWWQVTRGKTPTTYEPAGRVTRQEMASMLARWIDAAASRGPGQPLPDQADNPFVDVVTGTTHESNISRLVAAGVVNGTSATTFAPNGLVTRAQVAALLDRAYAYVAGAPLPAARDTFMDDNGNTHEKSIDRLAHAGIIGGTGGYTFAPQDPVRRDAMASLVMRASDVLVEQGLTTPPA
jgi:hypothetical protein